MGIRPRVCSVALIVALGLATRARAQQPLDGHLSLLFDSLPNTSADGEFRSRLFLERSFRAGERVKVTVSGFVEGLLGDRGDLRRAVIARPDDVYVDLTGGRFDLRAGFARIVWGRLDELQPSDIVNPLDISKFILEGRGEARLPVALLRGRLFLPHETTLEAILVPIFRAGRFDQLDEATSPFNLFPSASFCISTEGGCMPVNVERSKPAVTLRNIQGGLRLGTTTERIDWALSFYRGFESFGIFSLRNLRSGLLEGAVPSTIHVAEEFPRVTMLAGDFETVRANWVFRGEVAAFLDDNFQSTTGLQPLSGRSIEAGFGLDRKTGHYRLTANVLVQRRDPSGTTSETDLTFVAVADRSFARETRRVRMFAVYNATEETAFVRSIASFSLRDNLWLDASVGWFFGEGRDAISRFSDRDFLYIRTKFYF